MFCVWIDGLPVISGMFGGNVRVAVPVIGLCFSGYALAAAVLALAQPWLFARIPAGVAHGLALLIGAGGMTMLGLGARAGWLAPAFAALAISWSMMGTVPYAAASAVAPAGSGATTLRRFGFSTVLPQVATTACLTVVANWMSTPGTTVMLVGAAELAIAGVLSLWWHRWITVPDEEW